MTWTTEEQIKCLGVTEANLDAQINEAIHPITVADGSTFNLQSPAQVVTSMLSDVQEMIERGLTEEARQRLNCAKHIIIHRIHIPEREAAETKRVLDEFAAEAAELDA